MIKATIKSTLNQIEVIREKGKWKDKEGKVYEDYEIKINR